MFSARMRNVLLLLFVLLSVSTAFTGEFNSFVNMLGAQGKAETEKALQKKQWEAAKNRSNTFFRSLKDTKKNFETIVENKNLTNEERNKKLSELRKKNPMVYATVLSSYFDQKTHPPKKLLPGGAGKMQSLAPYRMYPTWYNYYYYYPYMRRRNVAYRYPNMARGNRRYYRRSFYRPPNPYGYYGRK